MIAGLILIHLGIEHDSIEHDTDDDEVMNELNATDDTLLWSWCFLGLTFLQDWSCAGTFSYTVVCLVMLFWWFSVFLGFWVFSLLLVGVD